MYKIQCPNCGSNIDYNSDGKYLCKYCNCSFVEKETLNKDISASREILAAYNFINQKKFLSAEKILKDAIITNPENGELYLAMLLCEMCVESFEKLSNVYTNYENNYNYLNAIEYLNKEKKEKLIALCLENKQKFVNKNNKSKSIFKKLFK